MKKEDFVNTLQKYSIISPLQIEILLKFYDPVATDMVYCVAFIEHMTNKDFVNIANQVTLKNDLIPYFYQKVLEKTERLRLRKIHESFKEALKQLTSSSDTKEETPEVVAAKNVNPILSATKENLERMIDDWMPGLSPTLKTNLVRHISVGERQMPSTSVWQSDGYQSLIRKFLECISISEYNQNVLFQENLFEDKEYFVDMTDGMDILAEILEKEKAELLAAEEAAKNAKNSKKK